MLVRAHADLILHGVLLCFPCRARPTQSGGTFKRKLSHAPRLYWYQTLTPGAQYALLFPGEAYERMGHQQTSGHSPKDSIWALYCRSMLLWNACSSIQRNDSLTGDERARLAIGAFQETQALQDALDMHVCNLNTGLIYVAREYLYKWVSSLPLSAPGVDASRHRYRLAERR